MAQAEKDKAGGLLAKAVGKSKEVAGSVLGNEDLKQEGQIHQQKVEAEKDAAKAEAAAQQREAEAAVAVDQRQLEAERRRLDAELVQEHQEDQIERTHRAKIAAAEAEAHSKKA
ncbi:MAG: hypothetical protein QOF20_1275, partial [Acidimicrobiaceae bacterium]|nr:hypothetical protein [Acidimicrobiaceae bacterium]